MEERELLRILETAFIHLKKDVNYKETKRKYQQALEEIVALIKPEITENWIDKRKLWIEDKANELLKMTSDYAFSYSVRLGNVEDFIRLLIKEIRVAA